MELWGYAVGLVVVVGFLLILRDVIASGVRRGILSAQEILDAEKEARRKSEPG